MTTESNASELEALISHAMSVQASHYQAQADAANQRKANKKALFIEKLKHDLPSLYPLINTPSTRWIIEDHSNISPQISITYRGRIVSLSLSTSFVSRDRLEWHFKISRDENWTNADPDEVEQKLLVALGELRANEGKDDE